MTGLKYIEAALRGLPATLDETYERMLTSIEPQYAAPALKVLRWLAYAQSPPTLAQLAEAVTIDPSAEREVDVASRGSWEDTLYVLPGLVTVLPDDDEENYHGHPGASPQSDRMNISSDTISVEVHISHARNHSKIRLAHFSIKEYLESNRILSSDAKDFHLDVATGHQFLAQSCLTYFLHYSNETAKTSTEQDFTTFPLLRYSAESWFFHSLQNQCSNVGREISLLNSSKAKFDWLRIHNPENRWQKPFTLPTDVASSIYYASSLGLEKVVRILLDGGAEVNTQGERYNNVLYAASCGGYEKVVRMLLDGGAEVNAPGGYHGNALQAASAGGHEKVVRMLLDGGAEVNAPGGYHGNALQAASAGGHEKVVRMLLDGGAEVNAQGGHFVNALQAASHRGNEKVVRMLLDGEAEVNAQGGSHVNALYAASWSGHEKVVQMLLDSGAEVNAKGGFDGNPLYAASGSGHEKVVQMLLDGGAEVNARGGIQFVNALQAASSGGYEKVVQMLLDGGAEVDALARIPW
nr:isoform 3 of ankyrin repeat and kh domain-containing protein 1 [Quercus suber]